MLKLRAQDADDLSVISAQMQDALIRHGDMKYEMKRRRFVLVANRFAWDEGEQEQRRRTGLHFENVLSVKKRGFANVNDETILSLLSVTVKETDFPAAQVELNFSAGHALLLDVEYLDCVLRDLGPMWGASSTPQHDT